MDAVRRAYGDLAGRYIDLFGSVAEVHPDDLAVITRHLSLRTGAVLDIGCGPGHLTGYLRSLGVDAIGVDLVPEFVEHARAAHPDGWYALGSMAQLPVPAGSVAGILAWYSLIHLPPDDLDAVLAELRRVTSAGAALVVGCFDGEEVDPFEHQVITAYRWPMRELAERLARAGFVEVERQQRAGIDRPGHRPHAAIAAVAV